MKVHDVALDAYELLDELETKTTGGASDEPRRHAEQRA